MCGVQWIAWKKNEIMEYCACKIESCCHRNKDLRCLERHNYCSLGWIY